MSGESLQHAALPLGITMGDAAGIGPELVVKLFANGLPAPAVVYGDAGSLIRAAGFLALPQVHIQEFASINTYLQANPAIPGTVVMPVINCAPPIPASLPLGRVSKEAGQGAYAYLCQAIDDAMAGQIAAIVTAPLHKVSLKMAGVNHPGHTEILAQRSGAGHVGMMLLNDELRVLLVSIHIPLSAVPQQVTHENECTAIQLAHQACRQLGIAQPRIAVAGLNPHAGEEGRFGQEDVNIIAPAIAHMREQGINVSGPYPGDTIFMRARKGEFDMVVAQYHDQGLIPVKYLGVDNGINVTVGLPFIRTSVDHGTAFDIAGKGIADESSLRAAFELAMKMKVTPE
ncbi:4-hydroxythreonine-4-phosphate dehydrogenase [Advenella faeciporci]|uniref:4-hydroxythreonine-4-phosphate dehydrogenase n=1 Tax=Advenella faeciporci TaxID=797535 RepID=A0A918JMG5_9BURK|nr:4-hydroxythreonine-4-phosphate dehydrogenase PdxA [Advenella faeciporci]GGW90017.1 4-hydroxythreonine-4-phosphate dehydrogenase [Advenella faeciporci]